MPALQLDHPACRLRPAPFPHLRPAAQHPPRPRPAPRRDALHDFLVPNPRPDLTLDPITLLMLARD